MRPAENPLLHWQRSPAAEAEMILRAYGAAGSRALSKRDAILSLSALSLVAGATYSPNCLTIRLVCALGYSAE